MLTYHAGALNKKVKGIVGMTFLDPRIEQVSDATTINVLMSRVGVPLVKMAVKLGLGGMRISMRLASKMSALVNDEAALQIFYRDRTSAGNWASQKFISTYVTYKPAIEPENFDICPILLTQPAQDRWSPLHLSELFLHRAKKVPVKIVMLDNGRHYPMEQPGLQQKHDAIVEFITANA